MSIDLGLLIIRVVVGLLVAGHGAQKLFGWFGGYGLRGTAGWMGSMGLRPAVPWTLLAGGSEFGGGLLLALGLLSPLGPLGVIAAMLTAIILVHWPKVWASDNGMEYPLVNAAAALGVGLAGPGAHALDSALGISLPEPLTFGVGLVLVALGVLVAKSMAYQAKQRVPVLAQTEQPLSKAA